MTWKETGHVLIWPALSIAMVFFWTDDGLTRFLIVGTMFGVFFLPLAILTKYWWERLLDRWCIYRLRVQRCHRRAEYMRWWDEHR